MKQVFQAFDGKIFESAIAALQYEEHENLLGEEQKTRVLKLPQIQEAFRKHGISTVGYWELKGESPDAYAPGRVIGIYHGTLMSVAKEAAKEYIKFFSYGSGGSINKIEIKELE